MSALSFTSAVAARPVGAAKAAKASVSTKVSALGGFGPNMPADEYNKKMAAKKATIEANKAKGGAKAGGLFSFGKKEAAPAPPAKKGFGFGAKKAAAPAPKAKTFAKPAFAKKDNKPAALSSSHALGRNGHEQVVEVAREDVLAFFPPAPPRDDGLEILPPRVVRVQDQKRALARFLVPLHAQ